MSDNKARRIKMIRVRHKPQISIMITQRFRILKECNLLEFNKIN